MHSVSVNLPTLRLMSNVSFLLCHFAHSYFKFLLSRNAHFCSLLHILLTVPHYWSLLLIFTHFHSFLLIFTHFYPFLLIFTHFYSFLLIFAHFSQYCSFSSCLLIFTNFSHFYSNLLISAHVCFHMLIFCSQLDTFCLQWLIFSQILLIFYHFSSNLLNFASVFTFLPIPFFLLTIAHFFSFFF